MPEWIGRTLSRVRIEKLLGRGGMAEVYLGRHVTLDRPVAVKVLHAHLSEDAQVLRRFRAEAQAVAALRHPNIVTVMDFDVVDGRPFIVMELLEGLSLADYLKGLHSMGHSLPLARVGALTAALAAALDYAHARGIVHRDVKPANVMLRRGDVPIRPNLPLPDDAEPVLTDFGVAHITGAIVQTASGTVLGTPAYMSPEQVRGEAVDARSDVYSLGIILYELLSGRLPFDPETDTPASLLLKQISQAPPALPNTAAPIQAVVDRALQKDRDRRYQRAGDMAVDLLEALGTPAAVTIRSGDGPTRISRRAVGARPRRIGLIAGLGLAGVAAAALAVIGLGRLFGGASSPTPDPLAPATPTLEAALAASAETPAAPVPAFEAITGLAEFQDSSFRVSLQGVPPPEAGRAYQAWLTTAGGGQDLGVASVPGGALDLSFQDAAGLNLLSRYTGFELSLEPVPDPDPFQPDRRLAAAQLPFETLARIQFLDVVTRGLPLGLAVLDGAAAQVRHYNSHLGFAVEAIQQGNLNGGRLHSEHMINIVEGRQGELFGDWNGDGQAQNPGDDFGLLPYLRLLREFALSDLLRSDLSADQRGEIEALRDRIAALIIAAEDARGLAQRITAGDTVEEVAPLAAQLDLLRLQPEVEAVVAQARDLLSMTLRAEVRPLAP